MKGLKKTLILLIFSMLSNCIIAQNYAQEFFDNSFDKTNQHVVYFSGAKDVIITNSKSSALSVADSLNKQAMLKSFNEEIKLRMKVFGLKVVDTNSFPIMLKDNESTFKVAQFEVEEFLDNDTLVDADNDKLKFSKAVNCVSVNVWFSVDENIDTSKIVFYNQESVCEDFDGYFDDSSYVNYTITELNPNDVYLITYYNAFNSAKYYYNYLLNKYVYYKSEGKDKKYYGITSDLEIEVRQQPFDTFTVLE